MELGFWGIDHHRAPLDIRDSVYFTDSTKLDLLAALSSVGISQCMILSTCNRCELYFLFESDRQLQAVREIYCAAFPGVALDSCLTCRQGRDALEYLYRVACGLESLVLGEDQILGQVKDALAFSQAMGYSKKELTRLVRDAVSCAKDLKTKLKISEIPLSVSYVGIRQIQQSFGIQGKTVFMVGSGNMAVLALKYLFEYGAKEVRLCSRRTAHAMELRAQFPDLRIVEYSERYQSFTDCDIIVSATSAPHVIIHADQVLPASVPCQVFLDLAMPRDIDCAIDDLPGCQVINLDTLQRIVEKNQRERESLAACAEDTISAAVDASLHWIQTCGVDTTIASLQQRCSEISDNSYQYLERKLELSEREKKLLKKVLKASLLQLIREPILELKQIEETTQQELYQQTLSKLFHL